MKKPTRLNILLIILIILIIIAICINVLIPEEEFAYNSLKGTKWNLETNKINQTLYLSEDDQFSYINNKTSKKVKNFENCTNYKLDGKNIKLNCKQEIKIIATSKTNLYLKINGKTKKFTKSTNKNYKIYQVGYIKNVDSSILLKTYDDFMKYINTYTNKLYDEKGIVGNSTDAIKNYYEKSYFENNNLAIYYVKTNSGSVRIKNVETIVNNQTLGIKYDLITPEVGTMDMNGFMIIVEVGKDIIKLK